MTTGKKIEKPEHPAHFDEYAREAWERICGEYSVAGKAESLDLVALSAYCMAYSRWKTAEEQIAQLAKNPESRGALIAKNKAGNYIQNPFLDVSRKAAADMVKYFAKIERNKGKGPGGDDVGAVSFLDCLRANLDLYRKVAAGKRLTAGEQSALDAMRAQYGIADDGTVRTQAELAALLGVDRRTVIRWKKEGMPVDPAGRYNVIRVIEWRADLMDDDEPDGVSEKSRWDIEFRKWRALAAEAEYKRTVGLSIDLAVAENLLTDRAIELKKSLLSRAKRLSDALAGRGADEVYQILEADVMDALQVYSRPSPVLEDAKKRAAAAQKDLEGGQGALDEQPAEPEKHE
jgi:P27 family predicted phage terminase small subunit